MYFNPSMNKLPPPVHPLSLLGLPGIAHNMCEIVQYTCIPEILLKIDASSYFEISTSNNFHRGGKKISICRHFIKFPERFNCYPPNLPPHPPVGWGLYFKFIFWAAHAFSRTFEF